MNAIQYLPHHNCAEVAAWLYGEDHSFHCEGEGDSDIRWYLPNGPVEPGQWLSRDGDTIHITDDEPES